MCVPNRVNVERAPGPGVVHAAGYTFVWEKVNEEVPVALFSVEGLKEPGEKVVVVDAAAGAKPLIVEDPFQPSDAVVGSGVKLSSSWSVRRMVVVTAAVGVWILLLGLAVKRWRRGGAAGRG